MGGQYKLNPQQRVEIERQLRETDLSYQEIGLMYGVSKASIGLICRGAGMKRQGSKQLCAKCGMRHTLDPKERYCRKCAVEVAAITKRIQR